MTLKPIEATTPLDEEAINPELVKAIRWAKQSGPVMTPAEFKAGWIATMRGTGRASVLRCDRQQIATISRSHGLR